MSSAFIRDSDDVSLSDIAPSLNALKAFLSRENNGMRIYEQKVEKDSLGREIHVMSNGLSYTKDESGKWMVVL